MTRLVLAACLLAAAACAPSTPASPPAAPAQTSAQATYFNGVTSFLKDVDAGRF